MDASDNKQLQQNKLPLLMLAENSIRFCIIVVIMCAMNKVILEQLAHQKTIVQICKCVCIKRETIYSWRT